MRASLGKAGTVGIGLFIALICLGWLSSLIAEYVEVGELWWQTPIAGILVVLTGDSFFYSVHDPSGVIPSAGVTRWAMAALGVASIAVVAVTMTVIKRNKFSTKHFQKEIIQRDGWATRQDIMDNLAGGAVVRKGAATRPQLRNAKPEDVGWRLGKSYNIPIYISVEESTCLIGPPRSGKGFFVLINSILDAPGAVVTTSTRPDNLAITLAARKKKGPVVIFDPQNLSGQSAGLKWSPITGCEDTLVATRRAASLMSSSAIGKSSSNQEWAGKAQAILSQMLHAAAVGGRTVVDLRDWCASPLAAREAVDILKTHGAPGWGEALGGVLEGDPKLLESSWFGITLSMEPLNHPKMLEAMNPAPGEVFHVEDFIRKSGTLYLLGTGSGAGAAGGFLAALMDDVVESSREIGATSPGGRLDPPLTLVLDEIANLFAWPGLPRVMADGGGQGINTIVVLQSLTQAETGWSKSMADTIWDSATCKILLGGAGNTPFLEQFTKLLGEREVEQHSVSINETSASHSYQTTYKPLLSPDEAKRLPQGVGILSYKNMKPVIFVGQPWIKRADSKKLKQDQRDFEAEQIKVFKRAREAA